MAKKSARKPAFGWVVHGENGTSQVEADSLDLQDGALVFYTDRAIVRMIADGEWGSVQRIDPAPAQVA